MLGQFLE